ncbi:MAG: hypothetical protein AAFX87_01675 [Bacteroidota bacterium]
MKNTTKLSMILAGLLIIMASSMNSYGQIWSENATGAFYDKGANSVAIGALPTTLSKLEISCTDSVDRPYTLNLNNTFSTTGFKVGILNNLSGGSNLQLGAYNFVNGTNANSSQFGQYNYVVAGQSANFAAYNYVIANDGSGESTASYNFLSSSFSGNTGTLYGVRSWVTGASNSTQYGVYSQMTGTGSGTKFGVYSTVPDSTDWAGYFLGRSYFSDKVGIGTTNPSIYTLAVKGDVGVDGLIHTEELEVMNLNLPDYVFEEDYELRSLDQVESYIKEHKHLPEVPSAQEVAENGMNVKDMNNALLKKVEELTLYIIEQNKRIERLEEELKK